MGIFSRMGDIFTSNVNDLLERAEDPAKMIRMIIMEMEETLVDARASAARTIADQKELRRSEARIRAAVESWDEKAELALTKGREDLARAALVEKQKLMDVASQMEEEAALLDEALSKHEEDIGRLEAKLREARARQSAIMSRLETAHHRARVRKVVSGTKIDEAFQRFEILERRVDMAEGRVEAFDLGKTRTLEDEFADLKAEDDVAAELAELKSRVEAKSKAGA